MDTVSVLSHSHSYRGQPESPYLQVNIGRLITDCLVDVVQGRPEDPIDYIAKWLYHYANTRLYYADKEKVAKAMDVVVEEEKRKFLDRQARMHIMKATIKKCEAHMNNPLSAMRGFGGFGRVSDITFQDSFEQDGGAYSYGDGDKSRVSSEYATSGPHTLSVGGSLDDAATASLKAKDSKMTSFEEADLQRRRSTIAAMTMEGMWQQRDTIAKENDSQATVTEGASDDDADAKPKKKKPVIPPPNWKGLKKTLMQGIRMTSAFAAKTDKRKTSQPSGGNTRGQGRTSVQESNKRKSSSVANSKRSSKSSATLPAKSSISTVTSSDDDIVMQDDYSSSDGPDFERAKRDSVKPSEDSDIIKENTSGKSSRKGSDASGKRLSIISSEIIKASKERRRSSVSGKGGRRMSMTGSQAADVSDDDVDESQRPRPVHQDASWFKDSKRGQKKKPSLGTAGPGDDRKDESPVSSEESDVPYSDDGADADSIAEKGGVPQIVKAGRKRTRPHDSIDSKKKFKKPETVSKKKPKKKRGGSIREPDGSSEVELEASPSQLLYTHDFLSDDGSEHMAWDDKERLSYVKKHSQTTDNRRPTMMGKAMKFTSVISPHRENKLRTDSLKDSDISETTGSTRSSMQEMNDLAVDESLEGKAPSSSAMKRYSIKMDKLPSMFEMDLSPGSESIGGSEADFPDQTAQDNRLATSDPQWYSHAINSAESLVVGKAESGSSPEPIRTSTLARPDRDERKRHPPSRHPQAKKKKVASSSSLKKESDADFKNQSDTDVKRDEHDHYKNTFTHSPSEGSADDFFAKNSEFDHSSRQSDFSDQSRPSVSERRHSFIPVPKARRPTIFQDDSDTDLRASLQQAMKNKEDDEERKQKKDKSKKGSKKNRVKTTESEEDKEPEKPTRVPVPNLESQEAILGIRPASDIDIMLRDSPRGPSTEAGSSEEENEGPDKPERHKYSRADREKKEKERREKKEKKKRKDKQKGLSKDGSVSSLAGDDQRSSHDADPKAERKERKDKRKKKKKDKKRGISREDSASSFEEPLSADSASSPEPEKEEPLALTTPLVGEEKLSPSRSASAPPDVYEERQSVQSAREEITDTLKPDLSRRGSKESTSDLPEKAHSHIRFKRKPKSKEELVQGVPTKPVVRKVVGKKLKKTKGDDDSEDVRTSVDDGATKPRGRAKGKNAKRGKGETQPAELELEEPDHQSEEDVIVAEAFSSDASSDEESESSDNDSDAHFGSSSGSSVETSTTMASTLPPAIHTTRMSASSKKPPKTSGRQRSKSIAGDLFALKSLKKSKKDSLSSGSKAYDYQEGEDINDPMMLYDQDIDMTRFNDRRASDKDSKPKKKGRKQRSTSIEPTPAETPAVTPGMTPADSPSMTGITPGGSASQTPAGSPGMTPERSPIRTPGGSPAVSPAGSPGMTDMTPAGSPGVAGMTPGETPGATSAVGPGMEAAKTSKASRRSKEDLAEESIDKTSDEARDTREERREKKDKRKEKATEEDRDTREERREPRGEKKDKTSDDKRDPRGKEVKGERKEKTSQEEKEMKGVRRDSKGDKKETKEERRDSKGDKKETKGDKSETREERQEKALEEKREKRPDEKKDKKGRKASWRTSDDVTDATSTAATPRTSSRADIDTDEQSYVSYDSTSQSRKNKGHRDVEQTTDTDTDRQSSAGKARKEDREDQRHGASKKQDRQRDSREKDEPARSSREKDEPSRRKKDEPRRDSREKDEPGRGSREKDEPAKGSRKRDESGRGNRDEKDEPGQTSRVKKDHRRRGHKDETSQDEAGRVSPSSGADSRRESRRSFDSDKGGKFIPRSKSDSQTDDLRSSKRSDDSIKRVRKTRSEREAEKSRAGDDDDHKQSEQSLRSIRSRHSYEDTSDQEHDKEDEHLEGTKADSRSDTNIAFGSGKARKKLRKKKARAEKETDEDIPSDGIRTPDVTDSDTMQARQATSGTLGSTEGSKKDVTKGGKKRSSIEEDNRSVKSGGGVTKTAKDRWTDEILELMDKRKKLKGPKKVRSKGKIGDQPYYPPVPIEFAEWGLDQRRLVCSHPRLGVMGDLQRNRKEASVEDWQAHKYSCQLLFDQEIYTNCETDDPTTVDFNQPVSAMRRDFSTTNHVEKKPSKIRKNSKASNKSKVTS